MPLKPKIEVDKTVILNLGVVTFLGVAYKLFGIANTKMLFVYIYKINIFGSCEVLNIQLKGQHIKNVENNYNKTCMGFDECGTEIIPNILIHFFNTS